MASGEVELFVPGRICLFGEHTDWAAGYRSAAPALPKGKAIIVGTDQGIRARVRPHPEKLIIQSVLSDGTRHGPHELPLDPEHLRAIARAGGFPSYVAGTAERVLAEHPVGGLVIENHRTDLPAQKGLSSSAAICVLTARAFNRVYGLGLSIREEMELAYLGERATPSQCGRLDQACAYGSQPVLLTFDGDRIEIEPLPVRRTIHHLIVDLGGRKDTQRILRDLNACYPDVQGDIARGVRTYLGEVSPRITQDAADAMRAGDLVRLGLLMREAQVGFDRSISPASPAELSAPLLHRVLAHPPLQELVLGGKGMGSQGDGTAQFIIADEAAASQAAEILARDFGMQVLATVIPATG